jgi:hypothetical protein
MSQSKDVRDYDIPSEREKFVPSESDQRVTNNSVRHQYRELNEDEKAAMLQLKDVGIEFLNDIDRLVPPGDDAMQAKIRIKEAVMWAVRGLTG